MRRASVVLQRWRWHDLPHRLWFDGTRLWVQYRSSLAWQYDAVSWAPCTDRAHVPVFRA